MDDREIIGLFLKRDEKAIEETAQKYGRFCFGIAFGILEDQEDTEECVNDAWQKLWGSIPQNQPEQLRPYLGRIVRNLAINRFHENRAQKRNGGRMALLDELEEILPSAETPEREWDSKEIAEEISSWLKGLKAEDRRLFIRRYWYDIPLKDLASETGMRPGKLAQKMHRLRLSLKKHLEERGISV